MPGRIYGLLLEQAQQQFGYITPADARALGTDPAQLRIMAARGTAERVSHALYRLPAVPVTSLDAYMEAVLWTRRLGALSHETALDLLDLCDVNPAVIHITVPRRFRTRTPQPRTYELHRAELDAKQVTSLEGLPVVEAETAIDGGIDQGLGWQLIDQAILTAQSRGLLTKPVAERLAARRHMGKRNV
jgi:predicted transcriptional regulator of viral defense system